MRTNSFVHIFIELTGDQIQGGENILNDIIFEVSYCETPRTTFNNILMFF